ncbi:MAG: hypothetical protein ACYC4S_09545 [Rhodoferax sp.]
MKMFKIFLAPVLGCALFLMHPAVADVTGRVTGKVSSSGEIEIDGVRYKLTVDTISGAEDSKLKPQELSPGQIIHFKSNGTSITQIKRANQQFDTHPMPPLNR